MSKYTTAVILLLFAVITLCHADEYQAPFVKRSLDKVIVVTPRATYTIPAPENSGTRVITIIEVNTDKEEEENDSESSNE